MLQRLLLPRKFLYLALFLSVLFILRHFFLLQTPTHHRVIYNSAQEATKLLGVGELALLRLLEKDLKLIRIGHRNVSLTLHSDDHVTQTFGVFESEAKKVLDLNFATRLKTELADGQSWFTVVLNENDPRLLNKDQKLSENRALNTHYVFCNGRSVVHLAVFVDRGSYYWVGGFDASDWRFLTSSCGHIHIAGMFC